MWRSILFLLSSVGLTVTAQAQSDWSAFGSIGYSTGIQGDLGGRGSLGGTAGLYHSISRNVELGVEAGHHRFGTETTLIVNFNGAGVYREGFSRSLWQADGMVRIRAPGRSIQPYAAAGVGVYHVRVRDRIEVRDAQGNRVPFYDFLQYNSETKPGLVLGAGFELPRALGAFSPGAHFRWHRILVVGPGRVNFGDFLALSLGLSFKL
jgi:hypothetical protein